MVVGERLDQGLLDFDVFMEPTDLQKYDFIRLPTADTWGLLMRKDDSLTAKAAIRPKDLVGVPLICSNQNLFQNQLTDWARGSQDKMNIIATYKVKENHQYRTKAAYVVLAQLQLMFQDRQTA